MPASPLVRRARRWAANLALAIASLLVTLLAIELAARVSTALEVRRSETSAPTTRYDPLLGWRRVPGCTLRIARPEFDVTLSFNSRGLRGPELPYERPAGARRVLLLGDSFAEGYYVEEPETARAALQRQLKACGDVQVVNGGMGGYSTDQEYLFYTEEGRRYGPALTAVLFYYNDLLYNTSATGSAGEPKPVFVPQGDGQVAIPASLVRPSAPEGGRLEAESPRPRPWRGSIALRLLSNRTMDANPALHRALARVGLVAPAPVGEPRELWPFGPWHRTEVRDMWNRTTAILAALRDAVEKDGGRLVVVYVPVRFEVDDAVWELTRTRYRWGWRWDRSAVVDRLAAACRELGVPLVDPREALRRSGASGRPAYYAKDMHWNATGNDIAARALEPVARSVLGCGE